MKRNCSLFATAIETHVPKPETTQNQKTGLLKPNPSTCFPLAFCQWVRLQPMTMPSFPTPDLWRIRHRVGVKMGQFLHQRSKVSTVNPGWFMQSRSAWKYHLKVDRLATWGPVQADDLFYFKCAEYTWPVIEMTVHSAVPATVMARRFRLNILKTHDFKLSVSYNMMWSSHLVKVPIDPTIRTILLSTFSYLCQRTACSGSGGWSCAVVGQVKPDNMRYWPELVNRWASKQ